MRLMHQTCSFDHQVCPPIEFALGFFDVDVEGIFLMLKSAKSIWEEYFVNSYVLNYIIALDSKNRKFNRG